MSVIETIKNLCKDNGIKISNLEKELGFGNGSLTKAKKIPAERIMKLSEYFNVSMDYLMYGEEKSDLSDNNYYINKDTADVAQEIFENDKILFDTYRSVNKDKLIAYAKKLEELRKMEEGE